MAVEAPGWERKYAGRDAMGAYYPTMWEAKDYLHVVEGVAVRLKMSQIKTLDEHLECPHFFKRK